MLSPTYLGLLFVRGDWRMHFIIKEIQPLRDSSSISSLVLSRANWKVDHLAKFGVDGEALFIGPM